MDTAHASDSLELEVSDFGPIINAKIELRPLTVFVGSTNTGKSYLAMLIYALHQFLSVRQFPFRMHADGSLTFGRPATAMSEGAVNASFEFMRSVGKRRLGAESRCRPRPPKCSDPVTRSVPSFLQARSGVALA